MEDNEIIKALECCPQGNSNHNCSKCNYRSDDIDYCFENLMKDALDLINRQKAEIERLETNCLSMAQTMPNMAKAERAEAVKEFAERLKEIITMSPKNSILIDKWYIDNLVKEMVGAE